MTTKARKAQNENGAVGDTVELQGVDAEEGVEYEVHSDVEGPGLPLEEPDAVTPEGEPMHTRTVRPYVDPADDPSGGITGVPVTFIPAPAVP